MSNRLAAGFTIAGFPLTAALLAITAANYALAAVMGLLFLLASLLTLAPKLPRLYALPLVGAPRLTGGFKANGSVEFHAVPGQRPQVTLAVPADQFPLSVLVQVGITNHTDQDVTHALINLGAPIGQGLQLCDGWGHTRNVGQPMPPTHEGYDYWSIRDWRFTGRDGHLFFFRLRIRQPGIYPVFLTVSSRSLYKELSEWAEIHIVSQQWEDLALRDQLSVLIDKGEIVQNEISPTSADSEARVSYVAWYLEVLNEMTETHAQWESFHEAKANWPGPPVSAEFYLAEVTTKLKRLYEIRDLLGSAKP